MHASIFSTLTDAQNVPRVPYAIAHDKKLVLSAIVTFLKEERFTIWSDIPI